MFVSVLCLLLLSHSALTVVVLQSGDQISQPGLMVTFECSMGPGLSMGSYTMYWYRQNHYGAPLEYLIKEYEQTAGHFKSSIDTSKNSFPLQITELLLNDSSTYYCAARHSEPCISVNDYDPAYFGSGTKLTVLEPDCEITKPTVQVLPPSTKECRDQKDNARKKTIVCVATGFYPDHVQVSWQINGNSVTNGVATDEAALREDKFYKITSRLRVLAKEWYKPDTKFTCTVSFFDGTETTSHSDSINGEEAKGEALTKEKYLRITQTAKFSYGVFIIKSITYGAFVGFLVWKLQSSAGKQNN
ncbi:T cell receptor beta chain MC.7.G5-like [Plectropomus leopardus]|uniref:T cell receptor beta chain MC.7.G5-like n=1 Tax=Plectropomus leopardus TaxID=160734 RepID=UPI001C4B676B|nr:T cell receptor beta chain MC.7.G5-like [Plectropomus leopardus]